MNGMILKLQGCDTRGFYRKKDSLEITPNSDNSTLKLTAIKDGERISVTVTTKDLNEAMKEI